MNPTQTQPAQQPLFLKIGNAISGLFGSQTSHYVAPATPAPQYTTRGVSFTPDDVAQLKKIIFSEVSNRPADKQNLEANVIFNTALNRVAESQKQGQPKTLTQILTQPNQYQGYNSPLYNEYNNPADSLTAARKSTLNGIVDNMVGQVKDGTFADNTHGAYYYQHKGDKIYYDDTKPLFAQN